MKVKVIIDGSLEGLELKQKLESEEFENKLKNCFNIRWGMWLTEKDDGISINSCQAIKNTLDKEVLLLTLRKNHINCPKRIKPGKKSDFPIIGRKYERKGGKDIRLIESLEEYKTSNCEYFLEYLEFIEEYVVHVMDTEVFFIEVKYLPKGTNIQKKVLNRAKSISKATIDKQTFVKRTLSFQEKEEEQIEPIVRSTEFGWKLRQTNLSHLTSSKKELIHTLAKKAVYALGLDFGVVSIGRTNEDKLYVLDVDSTCKTMSEACKDAYNTEFKKLLLKYDCLLNNKADITIGADPELILKDKNSNTLIFASDFFSKKGVYGLDDRSIESGQKYFPLVEIRPDYSSNPKAVAKSIKSILSKVAEQVYYKNIGLYSGSMPINDYWVGGHIHFGIKPNNKLIRALDNYLALPMMMIENAYSSRKRKVKYGALGNYRLKSHGGFEYCTLSSWLVTPEITTAVLCLSKVIVQEYLNLNDEFLNSYSDIRAFYLVNKIYFKDKLERIIFNLSKTKTYTGYKSEIEPLFEKILKSEVWEENIDLRVSWSMAFRSDEYKLTNRCYIPKNRRSELNIKLDDVIPVMIGDKKYKLKVYPKDDFSTEKEGFTCFSQDVCDELGIKNKDCVRLWEDNQNKVFRAGPILGIFSYTENHELGPFGLQSYYFRKLIKFSKEKGMIAYVFTIWDLEWEKERVNGYTYNFEEEQWEKHYFKIPDVIYDRGDVMSEDNYGKYAIDFIKYTKSRHIKFINSLECINLTNDKLSTYTLLKSNEKTAKYVIDSFEYNDDEQLIKLIEKYNHIYLKPRCGSRSKGIFSIEKVEDYYYEVSYKNTERNDVIQRVNKKGLFKIISQEISKLGYERKDYILQKAIALAKFRDRSFEIRVIMQKNSNNIWVRTCMVARAAEKDEKFMSVTTENDFKSSSVLSYCFGEKIESISNELRKVSKAVTEVFDSNKIQAGELAVDLGIDSNNNVFIIELNSKPDNLLATIRAYKMRSLAIYRLLEYAKLLGRS